MAANPMDERGEVIAMDSNRDCGGFVFPYAAHSFPPPPLAAAAAAAASPTSGPSVELQVTNLDQSMDQREMEKIITSLFWQHVPVLHVLVFRQSDGNMAACVRVSSPADAQYAISKLQKVEIGFKRKRIYISYSQGNWQNPYLLRSKVVQLLREVPSGKLQLFKFREMFEKRFHASIGISDLYKMKEVVRITEEQSGRMVQLSCPVLPPPSSQFHMPRGARIAQGGGGHPLVKYSPQLQQANPDYPRVGMDFLESAGGCPKHAPTEEEDMGWAEKDNGTFLPMVNIGLQMFAPNMRQVVKSHHGFLPLSTVVHCYESEFEPLPVDEVEGVPLEHLISCVKGLQIQQGVTGCKSVIGADDETLSNSNSGSSLSLNRSSSCSSLDATANSRQQGFSLQAGQDQVSPLPPYSRNLVEAHVPPLAGQLRLFSRNLVELLKSQPGCRMSFHKFIPTFHLHFGVQCRVADYGYTKLKDLFEALPHVVQILGEGSRAVITLSHRAQLKRFNADLLKLLQVQPNKQICLAEFPPVYEKIFGRTFKISDYGVCEIEDLLLEMSETSVVLSTAEDGDTVVSIPKREQTLDEVEKTQQFAQECVELLRHAPDCRLSFNKFIPNYHHHFGKQCRVAEYGFSKLIELFEAVPGTVEVTEDPNGERLLQLTDSERLKVVGDHIVSLVSNSGVEVKLSQLSQLYRREFGYQLRPDTYGHNSINALISSLDSLIRVEGSGEEAVLKLIDRSYIKALSSQVRSILAEQKDGKMTVEQFKTTFIEAFSTTVDIAQIARDLPDLVKVMEEEEVDDNKIAEDLNNNAGLDKNLTIQLVPLQLCAARIDRLIKDFDGILLCEIEAAFADKFGTPLCPGQFGFHSVNSLIQTGLAKMFAIRGRGNQKLIVRTKEENEDNTRDLSSIQSPEGYRTLSCPAVQPNPKYGNSTYPRGYAAGLQQKQQQQAIRFSTQRHDGLRIQTNSMVDGNFYHQLYRHHQQHGAWPAAGGSFYHYQNYHQTVPQQFRHQFVGQPQQLTFPPPSGAAAPWHLFRQQEVAAALRSHQKYLTDLAQFGIFPGTGGGGGGGGGGFDGGRGPHQPPLQSPRLALSPPIGSPISAPQRN